MSNKHKIERKKGLFFLVYSYRVIFFVGVSFIEMSVMANLSFIFSPPVCLEKLCHLGLEVQFAKRLMALYDSTI